MKKGFVFFLLFSVSYNIYAEEKVHKMLENGRSWNYMLFYYADGKTDTIYHSISLEGPIDFDDKKCYKIASQSSEETQNYFYEEGRKVYYYGNDNVKGEYVWGELFNFDLKAGENGVIYIDTINIKGENYCRMFFVNDIWIEGIGSIKTGPLPNWGEVPGTFLGSEVVSVYEEDVCVFTKEDFTPPLDINGFSEITYQAKGCVWQNVATYDLQGRRLSGKPAKGVYIENGRKVVK